MVIWSPISRPRTSISRSCACASSDGFSETIAAESICLAAHVPPLHLYLHERRTRVEDRARRSFIPISSWSCQRSAPRISTQQVFNNITPLCCFTEQGRRMVHKLVSARWPLPKSQSSTPADKILRHLQAESYCRTTANIQIRLRPEIRTHQCCCEPWAREQYNERGAYSSGGSVRRNVYDRSTAYPRTS